MDVSETYQKMCDYQEIQRKWKMEEGDYFFKKSTGETRFYFCDHEGWPFAESQRRFYVWLPRQDQLQEMLSNVEYKIELLHCFYMDCWQWLICVSKKEFKGDSAEQAWVQVYMWHKYYKTWNGQKWEDEK